MTLIERLQSRPSAYTVDELAQVLNISARSVYRALKAGKLQAVKVGSLHRIDGHAAAEWIQRVPKA